MQLTLFSDYALRLLMYLGLKPEQRLVPIVEVCEAFRVSRHYMLKVTNELAALGYIEAVRGQRGGAQLIRRPRDIRLGELVRQTEPPGGVLKCIHDREADCPIIPACRMRKVLAEAQTGFYEVLDRYTLADLLAHPGALRTLLPRAQ